MKNKTVSVYLALVLGTLGAHRFYLKGVRDVWAWAYLLTTAVGLFGIRRMVAIGQDDRLSWLCMPFFGIALFAACLSAIVYGLAPQAKWNKAYNKDAPADHRAGGSSGITIFGVILALLIGATALMSAIAFSGQRYFEYAAPTAQSPEHSPLLADLR
jgi:TM2 domain